MSFQMKLALVAVALAIVVACGGVTSAADTSTTIERTNETWQCNAPVDLVSVSVTLDASYTGTTADAVKLGPNCTGSIGRITILTAIADGIKVSGAHDLVIGGGIVDCYDHGALAHQDGTQVLAGQNITYEGVTFNCHSANNSDFYLDPVKGPVDNVICDHCFLLGTQSSTAYVLDQATNSGVENSTICQSRYWAYRHNLALDLNNSYPTDC